MKTVLLALLLGLSAATFVGAVPPIKGTIKPNKVYPRFQIGVTGAWAIIEPGYVSKVDRVDPGTPAEGNLVEGDVILTANGTALVAPDPRVALGDALTEAEAKDGKITLQVERGGKKTEVALTIPVLGAYGKTWPLGCGKSKAIIRMTAEKLVKAQEADGTFMVDGKSVGGLNGCIMALFLLSTGDDSYLQNVERFAKTLAQRAAEKPTDSSWHLGYQLIALCEYYLRTGDKSVLPGIESLAVHSAKGQTAGGWGHSIRDTAVGYVQSGLMNSGGVTLFLGLALARECGVTASEDTFQRALHFFYRMPGHGSVCYGDHRPGEGISPNGRNAAIACAMHVLGGGICKQAAGHYAMHEADSYFLPETGHTGGGFNILWRGIGAVLLPDGQEHRYRRHMDQLRWYYDLCRLPGGSFQILPSPSIRYSPPEWGYGIGLTYTAPLKTLRITGGPRTEFSAKEPPLPPLVWGTERDKEFLRSDYCEGFGKEGEPPHVIFPKLKDEDMEDAAYAARMLRHYSPGFRIRAAYRLAAINTPEAHEAIASALRHPDVRVRRAACDGIATYTAWGRQKRPVAIAPEVVSENFLPQIEKMLNDPAAAWWEVDGALWALGFAKPEDIRRNMPLLRKWAGHEEWFLREAAYWAVVGLGADMTGEEFLILADLFLTARHVYERNSFNGAIKWLLGKKGVGLKPDASTLAEYVRRIGAATHSALLAAGYSEGAARQEATHRVMMTLADLDDPPYALIVPDLVKYLEVWSPEFQHGNWLISGNGWQPGLCKIALDLGAEGKPLIEALRKCRNKMDAWDGELHKLSSDAREALDETLAEYDKRQDP